MTPALTASEETCLLKMKLADALVSGGSNRGEAEETVKEHFDYLQRVYPDATTKEQADIIRSL